MFIKEISIKNFKSFDDLNLSLNNLNVIIGANSSGKSNFITIFEFLRNISIYGLENAISITGGKDFIKNKYVLDNEDVAFKIKYKPPVGKRVIKDSGKQVIGFHISDIEYKFSIHFLKQSSNYQIAEDFFDIKYNFFHGKEDNLFEESNLFSTGNAKIYHDSKNMIAFKTDFSKEIQEYSDAIFPPFFREGEFKMKNEIFLETPIFDFFQGFNNPFKHISIYDFDPKRPKRAVKITGRTNLDEDGNNLSIVLSKIIQNKDNKKRFINLLSNNDVKLVLHGHLHETCEYRKRNIKFLNAGASINGKVPNSLSINELDISGDYISITIRGINYPNIRLVKESEFAESLTSIAV